MNSRFENAERLKNEGRFDEAIEELRLVLRLDPASSEAILRLGRLFYLSRQFPESISSFIHAEARGAKLDADDFFILGQAYAAKSFHRKAIESYDRSSALSDRVKTHLARGSSFQKLQDFDSAEGCYENVLRLDPIHVEALYSLANIHAEKGEFPEAIRDYGKWIDLRPEYASTRHSAAIVQIRSGNPGGALELIRAMLSENPDDPESFFLRGFAHAEMLNTEGAIMALEKCLALNTHHPLALSLLLDLKKPSC